MILPHNTDIENKLLASFLTIPDNFDKIINLDPLDFYTKINQNIFNALLFLANKKSAFDIDLVVDVLKTKKEFSPEILKHLTYLIEFSEIALSPYGFSKRIKDFSIARDITLSCMRIIDKAKDTQEPDKVIEYAQEKISTVEPSGTRDVFHNSDDLMISTVNRIEKMQNMKEDFGIDIGLGGLKRRMFIHGTKLIYLAGRPGTGKSAMMMAMAKHIALQEKKVGIISIEMDKEALADRMLSAESGINTLSFYRPGQLSNKDMGKIEDSAGLLSSLPIIFNDSGASIEDVKRRSRKMKKDACDIIFIDQLSKIRYQSNLNEFQGFSRNSAMLAELTKELRMPIIVLCQLGRKVEESTLKRPSLIHLKQTGSIEEDADMIFFIYRPGIYGLKNNANQKIEKSFTEMILAKNRNGIPGSDFSPYFDVKRGCFLLNHSQNEVF